MMSEIQNALTYAAGRSTYRVYGYLSQAEFKRQIDLSHPPILQIKWTGTGRHAVVHSGYTDKTGYLELKAIDPAVGAVTDFYRYTDIIGVCHFASGSGTWEDTVHC